jgi:hypothetical protein
MNERSLRNENLKLKREVAELRRKVKELEKYKPKHSDLTEDNTSALLPQKQTSPAEIALTAAAQKDPYFAAWLREKRRKPSWL